MISLGKYLKDNLELTDEDDPIKGSRLASNGQMTMTGYSD